MHECVRSRRSGGAARATLHATAPREPWRRRLVSTLLYGRNVDRTVKARARIGLAILIFAIGYAVIATTAGACLRPCPTVTARAAPCGHDAVATARPDVLDRNGEILATDVRTPSLFARAASHHRRRRGIRVPHRGHDRLDAAELRDRLASKRRFVWLKREITPKQREQIHRLGLPGIGFLPENKRVYPNGAEVSHVIGHVNIDNQGIAGIEKWLDSARARRSAPGRARHRPSAEADRARGRPARPACDARRAHRGARASSRRLRPPAVLTDVRTGEVISMVSVPDYDPNNPREALDPTRINRLTTGVYEMGSTFKALTLAMALDSGKITLKSSFDARGPLHYGKFTIHDYHAQNRVLTVPEIFTYSSNVGTARMALSLGVEHHKWFLRKMGQLDRLRTELPESAEPLVPRRWGELNTVTIAFGHGLVGGAAAGDDRRSAR